MSKSALEPLESAKGSWDEKALSRRTLLEVIFWSLAGVGGLSTAVAAGRFLVGNSLEAKKQKWVDLGEINGFTAGQVKRLTYSVRATDAWRETQQQGVLYAVSENNQDFMVFDATCTHLGCTVKWHEDQQRFACPCHSGFFTRQGEIISGPPPRPLRRLEAKVEDGVLKVLI